MEPSSSISDTFADASNSTRTRLALLQPAAAMRGVVLSTG